MLGCMRIGRQLVQSHVGLFKQRARLSQMLIVAVMVGMPAVSASAQEPPLISDFYCVTDFGDYWTLSGVVTDDDDPVEGNVVTFGGVLAGYGLTATTEVDGVFLLTVELPGLRGGTATALTHDPHGASSNLAEDWLICL
jgi:hypothetical protein